MEYDGYIGVIEVDEDANLLHGQVVNTRDVITFQGRNVKELRAALEESIDDYLEFCRKRGEEPEKPFSGKFMVRVDPSLHRELTLVAATEGKSVQSVVREAIQERVVRKGRPRAVTTTAMKPKRRRG
jgi:predicted HicB family RNase H-like nuclease